MATRRVDRQRVPVQAVPVQAVRAQALVLVLRPAVRKLRARVQILAVRAAEWQAALNKSPIYCCCRLICLMQFSTESLVLNFC
jgi:hypothetical protein